MKNQTLVLLAVVMTLTALAFSYDTLRPKAYAIEPAAEVSSPDKPRKTMRAFSSEKELKDYFGQLAQRRERQAAKPEIAPSPNAAGGAVADSPTSLSKDAKQDDSITNTQHAGVDEGGIVK